MLGVLISMKGLKPFTESETPMEFKIGWDYLFEIEILVTFLQPMIQGPSILQLGFFN